MHHGINIANPIEVWDFIMAVRPLIVADLQARCERVCLTYGLEDTKVLWKTALAKLIAGNTPEWKLSDEDISLAFAEAFREISG